MGRSADLQVGNTLLTTYSCYPQTEDRRVSPKFKTTTLKWKTSVVFMISELNEIKMEQIFKVQETSTNS